MCYKDLFEEFTFKAKDLNVAVIGETIIDQFVPVVYEGRSMKSNCSVLKLKGTSTKQIGGAGAIAGHLKDFVNQVDLITNSKNEIIKTRYIDEFSGEKYIEVNKFENQNFKDISIDTKDYDVVIVADFGHGLCDKLNINDGFHLMCQTNSNNFGFNRISKWKEKSKKSITLDKREASLQLNKKLNFNSKQDFLELYNYELNTDLLIVTSGRNGASLTDGLGVLNQKSFKSNVVDTIGAGDTFFSFACLGIHIYGYNSKSLVIPSLAASLSTTWLCNENNVNRNNLYNFILNTNNENN